MEFLETEKAELHKAINKLEKVNHYLNSIYFDDEDLDLFELFKYFNTVKEFLGNFNTDVSYLSCLLAKSYLCSQFDDLDFDASRKSQSAPGLDIDVTAKDSKRIIAEIKTTIPYKQNDFGSQQTDCLRKGFSKLHNHTADYKFLFVTDKNAYSILNTKYLDELNDIRLILLEKTEYNNEILLSDFADETLMNRICSNDESLDIVELGFKKAYECVYGSSENFSVYFDFLEDDGISLGFFEEKTVVEDVYVEREEIELSEAQEIKLSAKLGEKLLIPFNKELFTKESVLIALDCIYKKLNIQHKRQIRKSDDSSTNNTTLFCT